MEFSHHRPQHKVATVVYDGMCFFEFGIAAEVFAEPRGQGGLWYEFAVCTAERSPVRIYGCELMSAPACHEVLRHADTIVLPGLRNPDRKPPDELLAALRDAYQRGARLLSICTGSYVLGYAGLLRGRTATTHWRWRADFCRKFPSVRFNPDVLYTEDERILTSAGSSAGVDLCLHVVRQDFGSKTANEVARQMVVPVHRDHAHFPVLQATSEVSRLQELLQWLRDHLDQSHDVASMSRRVRWPPRTFARRFKQETGTTPQQWLSHLRVQKAKRLLEASDDGLDQIARRVGFGSAQILRRHFQRTLGQTPSDYRRTMNHGQVHGAHGKQRLRV